MTPIEKAIMMAKSRIGWSGASGDIPYAMRERYRTALAEEIIANAADFPASHVALARRELTNTPDAPLETYGVIDQVRDFGGEVANQAGKVGESIASVGEGVKSTLNLSKWVIPLAAIAAVVILLSSLARRTR